MSPGVHVEQIDLDALERGVRTIAERAYVLGPVGYRLVRRAVESERRLFAERPFAARKQSTEDRYTRPLRSMADDQLHLARGAGPLDRHGLLERTLTREHAPGQRDSISSAPGGLLVTFGVHNKGPVAYANFQGDGPGDRIARDPFRFDRKALDDGADDVIDYILERFADQ